MKSLFYSLTLFSTFLLYYSSNASDSAKVVFQFDVSTEIMPGTARFVSHAIDKAIELKADYILIHLNTYGGMLDAGDSIRTKLLNCPITSIVFIDNNAASAGALISIACNKIYMRSGANIGAATVVTMDAQPLPDKYQSYMRSMMRSTAEKRGRNPKIAEAMVDPRSYIPGVNDSGKVLTFTASEAVKNGYCDGMAETINEVLQKENINNYKTINYTPSFIEKVIGWLMNPAVSGVLILIIMGGIYFELQTPGIGFPLFAAIGAAILYFAPLYLEGLADNWEILIVIVGFVLIAVELLVIPGFGVIGITGIICIVLGFTFSMVGNEGFDFTFTSRERVMASLAIVLTSMIISLVLFFILGKGVLMTKSFNKLVLQDTMNATQGYISSDVTSLVSRGMKAVSLTSLRPSGKIIIDGSVYSANAESGFIEKDKEVLITEVDGMRIVVREILNS